MDEQTRKFNTDDDQPTRRLGEEPLQLPAGLRVHVCPDCGNKMVRVELGLNNNNGSSIVKRPGVWNGFLSGGVSPLEGFTCIECGLTKLYALEPGQLVAEE